MHGAELNPSFFHQKLRRNLLKTLLVMNSWSVPNKHLLEREARSRLAGYNQNGHSDRFLVDTHWVYPALLLLWGHAETFGLFSRHIQGLFRRDGHDIRFDICLADFQNTGRSLVRKTNEFEAFDNVTYRLLDYGWILGSTSSIISLLNWWINSL